MSEQHQEPDSEQSESRHIETAGPSEPELHADSPADSPQVSATDEDLHVDRYEGAWIRISTLILAAFLVAITVSAFVAGFQVPGAYQRIDPATLNEEGSPFAEPEVRELAPGKYEVYVRAQIWRFTPEEIRIPAGSQVTFYITSQDVQHGFKMVGTNINLMILPGQISTVSARFEEPGTYNFICHEFCGQLHHSMYGRLVVEAPEDAEDSAETALALD